MSETLQHIDLCHGYIWVFRDDAGQLWATYADRAGSDLKMHRRDPGEGEEPCDRCTALSRGAEPRDTKVKLDSLPEHPVESLLTVMVAVGEAEMPSDEDERGS